MGSPPPAGSKKVVLKLRSVNNIVIAPARTGKDSSSRTTVIRMDQTNRGMLSILVFLDRMLRTVVMKLMAPRIEEAPAKWRLKMAISTLGALWKRMSERGGYTVQPVPTPAPDSDEEISSIRDGGSSQNLILFIRGKAMSGAPIIIGTNQLPNPPIIIGITMKKIMTKACAVTIVL